MRRWGKCQLYTGYFMLIGNGISAVCNFFMLFALSNWSEIPFWDYNGVKHTLKMATDGLFFMSVMKIIASVLLMLWGRDAVKTYKPIVKEMEKEDQQGVCPHHVQEADSKASRVKKH
jgi:hypothetical protein